MPRRTSRSIGALVVVAVVIAAVAVGPRLVNRAWHSFTRVPTTTSELSYNPTARLTSLSSARYPLWKAELRAFDTHPIFGIGAGTTEFWWNEHATSSEFVRDAHNIWLQNMAELGVPGLLLIVAVAVSALGVAIAVRRRVRRSAGVGASVAFLAAFVVYLFHASVDWMWESTAVTVLALGGVAILGARLAEAGHRVRIRTRAPLVLVAIVAGLAQLPGLLSTTEIRRSQAAERTGQVSLAYQSAQDAVRAEPWSASAYEQLGLVLEGDGRLRQAAIDLKRAIAREPQNYEHWLVLARIETELGQLGPALRDYDRARQLSPRALVFEVASAAVPRR
jgi:O-antigen ligase